jgi:hypothetical protein
MRPELARDRSLLLYVVVTAAFWLACWAIWGGTGRTGGSSVHLGWQGAAFNLLMLGLLLRGWRWARGCLIFQAMFNAVVVASLGVPPFGPSFGVLAFVAVLQAVLLLHDAGLELWPLSRRRARAG